MPDALLNSTIPATTPFLTIFPPDGDICVRCKRSTAANGKSRCEDCLSKGRQGDRARRSQRMANGNCIVCSEPSINGKACCEDCLSKVRQGYGVRRDQRIANGDCYVCGEPAANGKSRCDACIVNRNHKRQTLKDNRRIQGNCIDCGHPSINGKTYCETCIVKRHSATKARRDQRKAEGNCIDCGHPAIDNKIRCETCISKRHVAVVHRKRWPVVYFMQDLATLEIKIGTSIDVQARLKALQANQPRIILLVTIPGGQREEQALHSSFSHLRTHGEWFLLGPDLREFIDNRM